MRENHPPAHLLPHQEPQTIRRHRNRHPRLHKQPTQTGPRRLRLHLPNIPSILSRQEPTIAGRTLQDLHDH